MRRFLSRLFSSRSRRRSAKPARPLLESLEDRQLLSVSPVPPSAVRVAVSPSLALLNDPAHPGISMSGDTLVIQGGNQWDHATAWVDRLTRQVKAHLDSANFT